MDTESLEYKVGAVSAHVSALATDVSEIKVDQKAQNGKLDLLVEDLHRRKGAKSFGKTVMGVVASSGFLGWIWEHFSK